MSATKRKISFSADAILYAVVQDGDTSELLRILSEPDNSIEVNQANHSGLTALHQGVLCNNLDAVKILLSRGADVNARDANGVTPLHAAGACGFLHVASLLIVYGADVFLTTGDGDRALDLTKDEATAHMLVQEMCERSRQRDYLSAFLIYSVREKLRLLRRLLLWIGAFILRCIFHVLYSHDKTQKQTDGDCITKKDAWY